MRIVTAFRAFWTVLCHASRAAEIEALLTGGRRGEEPTSPSPARTEGESRPATARGRSEAVTLLATLQREARFVDIVKEPLDQYSDAQIGAAARDVLRDCGGVLERLFAVRPLVEQEEGSRVELPAGFDVGRFRLKGEVPVNPPAFGRLEHHGWEVTQRELPQWSGSEASASVVAPAELTVE